MTFVKVQPFSQEVLNKIFEISTKHSDRLVSRESNGLEFKESFGFGSLGKYIRTAAGFANAKGGYIVYGIGRSPHTLLGLKSDTFDTLDPEKLTHYLNEHFDPMIHWDQHLYELGGNTFGLLYFYESANKPVICKKNADDTKHLKEGEIYFRYRGRTQTIRYAELKELIDERRKHEQLLWFKHLKEIARVGITETGIFDLRSGKVAGTGGHVVIDENLLSQISFIREGEFNEITGKPALKIIGEARTISATSAGVKGKPHIIKTKGIRGPDIVLGFLRSEKIDEPQSFLTQICYENTAFLPFYFLLRQGKMTLEEAARIVGEEHSTQPAKAKLLQRIKDDSSIRVPMPFDRNAAGQRKLKVREALLNKEVPANPNAPCLKDLLAMIRTLQRAELDHKFVKGLLEKWFNKHYAHGDPAINHEIRRAVCYVDWLLNRQDSK